MDSQVTIGDGNFKYKVLENWEQMPEGYSWPETAGVATDADDNVYVFNRGEHPMMVFDKDGNFLRSWGEGIFTRAHGVSRGPDNTLYCTDDGDHTVRQCTLDGKVLMTIGNPGNASDLFSGNPFNRCTHTATDPDNGDIFVTDGYGNSRVHRFTPAGEHVLSWGEPGIDAGQFIRPHNIAIDEKNRIYIADRESHRVQIFDENGSFITMWNNIHRPDGLTLAPDGNIYIGELNGMGGMEGAPNLGHRVSVYNQEGERLAVFGEREEGVSAGHFIAPHGIAVDSHLDIYVGEVSFTIHGRHLDPPQEVKSFTKLIRLNS